MGDGGASGSSNPSTMLVMLGTVMVVVGNTAKPEVSGTAQQAAFIAHCAMGVVPRSVVAQAETVARLWA